MDEGWGRFDTYRLSPYTEKFEPVSRTQHVRRGASEMRLARLAQRNDAGGTYETDFPRPLAKSRQCPREPFNRTIASGPKHMVSVFACRPKTVVPCSRDAARKAAGSSPSATREPSATPSNSFPKSARLLRPTEFRKVYDEGFRVNSPLFSAFCWKAPEPAGVRVGLTLPRALGKAVRRNRMKRRLRDAVRRRLAQFDPHLWIVVNPRRAAFDAPSQLIEHEVDRLVERCASR